ncbi:MAG: hypothetical protein ACOYJA_00570 [Christensenellales bacterium]|jgi:Tfp pilus assembly protein PilV
MRRAPVRSKSSLFLLELMVVLLLFALSSTVCVKLFAQAKLISRHSADTTMAVLHAQQVAERIKSQGEQALTDQGAAWAGTAWTMDYGADWQPVPQSGRAVYRLRVTPHSQGRTVRYALALTRGEEPLCQLSVVRLSDPGGEG